MKLAVTATGPALDAQVDPRFGRCPYFLIVNTDDMSFDAVENPNVALGGGAGIQSGQLMAGRDVEYVLTGNCGPNAHRTLQAAGVETIVGCSGSVRDVVEAFKAGTLQAADAPNVASHYGMGQGGGMGMGRGGGMGMGQGGGMGMGRGGGMGQGAARFAQENSGPSGVQKTNKDQELKALKEQAEALSEQMEQIQDKIRGLGKKE